MLKKGLFFLFFVIHVCAFSQELNRVKVIGKITVPLGEDVEGVNIYNLSSQYGVITDVDGSFELEVAKNDRIQITALQFQSFVVIVDKGIVDSKKMAIYLNPAVNQLEEVVVNPYDLSGNIRADVGRIKTQNNDVDWDMSYETLEFGYEFSDDQYSTIRGNKAEEVYFNEQKQAGLNFIGLVGLLFPKKKRKNTHPIPESETMSRKLLQRVGSDYIIEMLKISEDNIYDFIYFLEDHGIDRTLLKEENKIRLLEFLFEQSTMYKLHLEKH